MKFSVAFGKFDRRAEDRGESEDRRDIPRPPLWLNFGLLLLALLVLAGNWLHRDRVEKRFGHVIIQQDRTPDQINNIKNELAEMDLAEGALKKELEGRMEFVESLKSEDFYLAVDTEQKKIRFYYGGTVLREGDIVIGEASNIHSPDGKSWTFVPVKGAFPVEGKLVDHAWRIPEWLYVLNHQPIPRQQPAIKHGLGRYVILLGDGYVIHSPPAEKSPLKGAKPGSIMAQESDLRAIWPRIHEGTPVYIF